MSAQMRLIFTGLAFTILISLYISQQSINCYHFMQMTDEEMRYDYADDSEEFEYSSSQMSRAKAIRKEPYNCGVLFFYHIPSTGGSSINRWLRKYQKPENGNYSYYQRWGQAVKNGKPNEECEDVEKLLNSKIDTLIQNLGPSEWKIAHSHLCNNYLNESDAILTQWRSTVESQGCGMINSIMLRDPLNHAMSLYKVMKSKGGTRENWATHLHESSSEGKWHSVLDFLLYNIQIHRYHDDYPVKIGRNPFNVTKEEKVKRALQILDTHFDVITIGDHTEFKRQILELTGWIDMEIPHSNVYKKELEFTKKEVEYLQKGLTKNGDIDFIDMVKLRYQWPLSYLTDALDFRTKNAVNQHEFIEDGDDDDDFGDDEAD